MAQDFDEFFIYDPIIGERPGYLSNQWVGSLTTFWQTLVGYLSQWGIFMPQVTTKQRNALISPLAFKPQSIVEGQMIYNSDRKTIQVYLNGAWQEVTTSPAP